MRSKTSFLFSLVLAFCVTLTGGGVTACSPDGNDTLPEVPESPDGGGGSGVVPPDGNGNENNGMMKILVKIDSKTYTATLADTPAAAAFREMLPLTLHMEDVNRNEKFKPLPQPLPAAASNPGTIRTGDLMLYGADGLVLFYKTFSTSYSYTRIGALDDPTGLEGVLGTGRVTVVFEPATGG